jgi:hypothetical protein
MSKPLLSYTNTTIIISRYNESIDFIVKLQKFKIIIYEKENMANPYNVPVNKGHEATIYLKYIIDHWENLPEYLIFLHCHEYSWHHDGSIADLIHLNINKTHSLTNLNNYILGPMENLDESNTDIALFYKKYIFPATGPYKLYPNFTEGELGCAQYIVHRSNIYMHSKKFYMDIYDWLITTEIDNYYTSRFMEWAWNLFWNKCLMNIPIKKYIGEEIIDIKNYHVSKEEIINFLNLNNYYYIFGSIILTVLDNSNNKNTYIVSNQYIYNKFV